MKRNRPLKMLLLLVLLLATGCQKDASVPAAAGSPAPASAAFSTVAPTEAPTPAPTPTPTPAPPAVLHFSEDEADPLPSLAKRVLLGGSFRLRGVVESSYPLTSVTVSLTCYRSEDPRYPYERTVTFAPGDNVMLYLLDGANTKEGVSLDSLVKFSELHAGLHTLTLTATTSRDGERHQLQTVQFRVLSDDWERIQRTDFNGTYESTSKFFRGRTARFLYRYQWVYDRYVIADPAWEAKYITAINAYGGRKWQIHVDAKPYYDKALAFLARERVRVSGTNGDSGVVPLHQLILTYNGSYVPRFTSTKKTISHHAFGTATDINAALAPNNNLPENLALIDTEVQDFLVYNGILEDAEGPYYDFTYSGSYASTALQIPDTVINYLLFELAFRRAGFLWGHYYKSTSDAMHFTLSDSITTAHRLQKVFAYTSGN